MHGQQPVVAAFIKDDPAKAASLVASIQKLTETHSRLKTFVVFTGGSELKEPIEKMVSEKKITIPVTFLPKGTGAADFQGWRINPQAKNTFIVYSRTQVRANFVDVTDKTFDEVAKATEEMLK